MRIYGSVQICFWENNDTRKLSDQAKLLAIYLLTGPHSNMLGCFRLPDGYITEDLGWSNQTVKSSFDELEEIEFLARDFELSWIAVHDFLKWNPIQNPKQGVGIEKIFNNIPERSMVFKPIVMALVKYGRFIGQEFTNRITKIINGQETVYEKFVTDKNQKNDHDQYQGINIHDVTHISKSTYKSQAIEILEFLNHKTGRAYQPVEANLKLIISRLSSGATVIECRQVIAKKTREWKDNPLMNEYLRPATLFNAVKFEQYRGELVLPKEDGESEFN